MHPAPSLPDQNQRMSPFYERATTMGLGSLPRHSLTLDSLRCAPHASAVDYFGLNSVLTPPESVTADDMKSETLDESDVEFTHFTNEALVSRARDVINSEAQSLNTLAALLVMDTFIPFIRIMHQCRGHIILTGIGKSGLIAQKISATLASTGRPSFFLHSAEALHGDMGRITRRDVVIALSNSGEGPELSQIAKSIKASPFRIDGDSSSDDEYIDSPFCGAKFLLITGNARSSLTRYADAILCIGEMAEACAFNVVPTNTTTAMLALGDALALCLFELLSGRRYSLKTFANFHPGGSLGKKLVRVQHVMAPCGSLIQTADTLRDVISTLESNDSDKSSTVVIVDTQYRFVRLFTDRDLRKLLLVRCPESNNLSLDSPIGQCLAILGQSEHHLCTLSQKMLVGDAHRMMELWGLRRAVVTDDRQFPIGILNM
jgi:arabinose-5-phosphate isomerase